MSDERFIFIAIDILREMAKGRTLTLSDGRIIGMTENGFVGFGMQGKVSLSSEITLSQLIDICKEENIITIPT